MIHFEINFPDFNPNWLQDCTDEIVEAIKEEVQSSWKQEQNPSTSEKWPPRKQPTGTWPLLNKTGRLFNETSFKSEGGNSPKISASFPFYGKYHQDGNRPWLGVPPSANPKIGKIIAKSLFK